MNLLAENRALLNLCIDGSFGTEASIVSRYRNAVRFYDREDEDQAFKRHLLACSIREGARIVPLFEYKGVVINIMDETSWMATGSLKSVDGCLTTAFCRMEGDRQTVFESGGNTGSALTLYGQRAGIETFFFCPAENMDLLDGSLFDGKRTHLIGVHDRGRLKDLTRLFAEKTGIRHIPDKSWRYMAAMFRGLFILEQMLTAGGFDWISQTVSAGFGPIGIYNVLKNFVPEIKALPRFLGVQQEANCPMFRAWKPAAAGQVGAAGKGQAKLLTRVMYDDSPQTYKTFEDLRQLLLLTRGDLLTVNEEEFNARVHGPPADPPLLEALLARGIDITLRSGQVVEKTGLIALVGTLKAIDAGIIAKGSKVLCCLTSGVSKADGRAEPELTVRDDQELLAYLATHPAGRGR